MKSEQQLRKELELVRRDLREWRAKFAKEPPTSWRYKTIANTILGLEGQVEALEWALEDE